MCTYELLRDDTELGSWYFNSYFSHVSGLCQVIRNVDKSYEPSPAMQYAWREARLMAFRSAMFLRQPIFGLGRPPQWSSTTPSLKLSDDVLDNMFDLATWFPTVDKLMKRMDQMQHTAAQSAAVPRVVDRGIELARELMAWEERAMALYCNDRRPTLYSLCSTADGELLNVLTHHWMICMLLHSQLQLLVARCSLWHPHLKLPFWIDGWPYATFISVAGPLFSNPRFGIWSALASHTPMIATNFYFAANGHWHTSEARSLRNFVEDRNRPGNGLMRKFFYGLFARADVMIPQDGMVKAAQAWYGVRDSTPWKGADESRK
ncbi:hypothetical protein M409DRAFT_23632 [Zasmidium cellare ATCC 36951]|uniref:Uncharacterized protein n=1 Tax=Zasmidium cellare ATCC 36951 TaxID=1080233 RepID=A0A6A6CI83_ZASCE|nr:uncharacterized protein M409DRAFT_23632 [Zasmidium cellare ATCC 36951]KAF2165900.1 hypothetical protein M409DRAFT_23632 [Zasmidium cellare ATCC 36951]